MAKLFVRSALTDFDEAQRGKDRDDFAGFEDRDARHSDDDGLRADEFGFELGFAVFEQHGDDFAKVGVQLVEGGALTVRAPESRHIAHVKLRVRTMLDDRRIRTHGAWRRVKALGL
jgi:hypothetical protein